MPGTRSIHIVDDDDATCLELRQALAALGCVVRSFASAADYLTFGTPDYPDCLLLDVGRSDHRGFDLQQRIAHEGATVPVIFITANGDIPMAVRAMKAGAIDFLTKPVTREALIAAVLRALAKRDEWRGAQMRRSRAQELFVRLTPREREVFVHLLAGQRNKQIAGALESREATIKVHRSRLMRKLEARTLAELLQIGRQLGLEPSQQVPRAIVEHYERQPKDVRAPIDRAAQFSAARYTAPTTAPTGRSGAPSRPGTASVPTTADVAMPYASAANDSFDDVRVAHGTRMALEEAAGLPKHPSRMHAINHTV